jgi:hypothetical protein
MPTPVVFLDEASAFVGDTEHSVAQSSALQLVRTLREMRKHNTRFAANSAGPLSEYRLSSNWTLQAALGGNGYVEEWRFIRGLAAKSPLSDGFDATFSESLLAMDYRTPSGVRSSALAWAALMDTATVSSKGQPEWSEPWIDAECDSLTDVGGVETERERVRNASDLSHVTTHQEWLSKLGFDESPPADIVWAERAARYPGLRFLARCERDLHRLDGSGQPYVRALAALESLSKDSEKWHKDSHWPSFSTKASPESETREKLCLCIDESDGKEHKFDWHTRFTGSVAGRVHFRVDAVARSIVVAYIGVKLSRAIGA